MSSHLFLPMVSHRRGATFLNRTSTLTHGFLSKRYLLLCCSNVSLRKCLFSTGAISRSTDHSFGLGLGGGSGRKFSCASGGAPADASVAAAESQVLPEPSLFWLESFPNIHYVAKTHPTLPPSLKIENSASLIPHSTTASPRLLSDIPVENAKLAIRRILKEELEEHPCATEATSHIHTYGLFTQQPIKRGELLGEYTGAFLHDSQIPDTSYALYVNSDNDHAIDASQCGNMFRFVNDYRNIANGKNVEVSLAKVQYEGKEYRVAVFYATRDIKAGEELLWDYGTQFWVPRAHLLGPQGAWRLKVEDFIAEFGVVSMFASVAVGFLFAMWLFEGNEDDALPCEQVS
mmetsp:Transcript_10432/g.38750  ORF Transcript_10432/g.38750 Transcript_10432/m.38750 type:complete len:346 (-) Transcript_10432:4431-5468(-)